MSDMLQLVVEIHNTQAMILPVTSHIESSQSRRQAEAYRTLMRQVYCYLISRFTQRQIHYQWIVIRDAVFNTVIQLLESATEMRREDVRLVLTIR